jgi:DNA-binding NtrC family response regulator
VEAVLLGAFDYVEKPFDQEQIRQVVAKALKTHAFSRRDPSPEQPAGTTPGRFRLVGDSPAIRHIYAIIEKVANTPSTVLITGESGTGKELIARARHENSARHQGPFIKINCAAIPKTLMESELFGYEKGAFTGAVGAKPGRFELAHGGTLFLDEIGEIPVEMQVKLLRVLQESEFERVGGIKTIKVDVRLVTATNRDLALRRGASRAPGLGSRARASSRGAGRARRCGSSRAALRPPARRRRGGRRRRELAAQACGTRAPDLREAARAGVQGPSRAARCRLAGLEASRAL